MAWWRSVRVVVVLAVVMSLTRPAGAELGGLEELYEWAEEPVNRVANPSFESLEDGWSFKSSFTLAEEAADGIWSLRLTDSHLASTTPAAIQTLTLEPGWYTLRGWLRAVEAGTNSAFAGGRLGLRWSGGSLSTETVRGTTPWMEFERRSIPVGEADKVTVRLEAYGKPDGTVFFDQIQVHRQIPPAVEGFLLYPNYRGVLFDDRGQDLLVSVRVRPEEVGRQLEKVSVRLRLETASGIVVGSARTTPPAPVFTQALDAGAAPLGPLRLRLQLMAGKKVLFEYPAYRIVKLPGSAREGLNTWVDTDNVLVLKGQRTFVLGVYDTSGYSKSPKAYEPRISKIAEAPLNLYLNYWLGGAPVAALDALMTTLDRYGMGYLHTVNNWYEDKGSWPAGTKCGDQTAASLGPAAFTACMAAQIGVNPGLAGWYTADELPAAHVERVFGQYAILRQHAPDGVAFVALNKRLELERWRDAVDVLGVDPYPIYGIPLGQLSPLEAVTDLVEAAQAAVEGSRPVWAVIQYFKFGSKGHFPTYDELRSMSYMAIVAGARGLFYWSYGTGALASVKDEAEREAHWQDLVQLTTEIRSLEPVLLATDAPEILAGASPAAALRVLPKQVGGTRYLLVVNNAPDPVQATFHLTAPARRIEVVGEQRRLRGKGTTNFKDAFGPYAVHVYRIP